MSRGAQLKSLWRGRRRTVVGLAALVVAGASFGAVRLVRNAPNIPTAEVKRGEFVDQIQVRGEVKAQKSVVLNAPAVNVEIQIIKLVRNGTLVKKGDVVVQMDVSKLQQTLAQKRSEVKQAEAEIEQARAKARLLEEQDMTDLQRAHYDVERAKLEVSKAEIISRIEGEEKKLELANAEQKLKEAEQKLKSDRDGADADVKSKMRKRDKARFEVQQAERDIAQMTLRAPAEGMVSLLPNWRAGGFFSDNAPEFREGDRAWSGAGIAELPDLSTLQLRARIEEADRGRLKPGQTATMRVDAVPDKEFTARVAEISPLAKTDFSGWPPKKNFDLALQLDQLDPRLRPGMSATARVAVERLPDSILVPPEALFQKSGNTVAYVLNGSKFEERGTEIARRGEKQVAVARGLKPGERVALKDPTAEEKPETK